MIKLLEKEDCHVECDNMPRIEGEKTLDFLKRVHNVCVLRVNLRGAVVRPCHKLIILSREWAEQYRYEHKYFQFRS